MFTGLWFTGYTHGVDEEPVVVDDVIAEEEGSTLEGLFEEVGGEEGDPLEDGEAGAGFEDEHGDRLLGEEADDDGGPSRFCQGQNARDGEGEQDAPRNVAAVLRRRPEAELEDEETEDGDRTVSVAGVLQVVGAVYQRSSRGCKRGNGRLTPVSLKPKAEPKTMPMRASQPMLRRT